MSFESFSISNRLEAAWVYILALALILWPRCKGCLTFSLSGESSYLLLVNGHLTRLFTYLLLTMPLWTRYLIFLCFNFLCWKMEIESLPHCVVMMNKSVNISKVLDYCCIVRTQKILLLLLLLPPPLLTIPALLRYSCLHCL